MPVNRMRRKRLQRSRNPVTGQFRRAPTLTDQAIMVRRTEVINLDYMIKNNLLKHMVFCDNCWKENRYRITGQEDNTIPVRMAISDGADHSKTYEPFYNETHVESNYLFKIHQECALKHAEKCFPTMRQKMNDLERAKLKNFDYSKNIDYPKFKIQMSFDEFDKNTISYM